MNASENRKAMKLVKRYTRLNKHLIEWRSEISKIITEKCYNWTTAVDESERNLQWARDICHYLDFNQNRQQL